jgi:four helix bundle protein
MVSVSLPILGKTDPMRNFKQLVVWQKAMNLTDPVFELHEELPWQLAGELKGQSTRAAISIPSNIAEGSSRRSEKDMHRFMEIALGSAFELETQTLILQRRSWAPQARMAPILQSLEEQQKMLHAFMARLKR